MITIHVDYRKAVGQLKADAERHVPFALAKAVNDTALDVQRAQRANLRKKFTLRRPEWADRSIKMVRFAKKSDPTAVIGIHPPGGDQRADILDKFEDQTEKLPKAGTIAIPVSRVGLARGSAGVLRNRVRPRDLVASGKAFIVRKRMGNVGEGLILQRVGFGQGSGRRSSVVALYYLARRARIRPTLQFIRTAGESIDDTFASHMVKRLDEALRTAR